MAESPVIFNRQSPYYGETVAPVYPPMQGNTYGNQFSGISAGMPAAGLYPSDKERMVMLDAEIRKAENQQRHVHRMEENAQKAYIKEQHEEQKLVREQCKELEQKSIYRDDDGDLRIQSKIPGRKVVVSDPIISKRGIRLEKIVSSEPIDEIQVLYWDGAPEEERVYLVGKDCSGKGFTKALAKAGLSIRFGRDKRHEVADMVYSYLSKNSSKRYLKRRYGWNKRTDGGWEFADETEETVQSILDKVRRG